MRYLLMIALLVFGTCADASQTLRVDQQVLAVGDTATHTMALLGTPTYKEPVENKFGAHVGERWQYVRDNGPVVTVTIIAGRVADIDDRQN